MRSKPGGGATRRLVCPFKGEQPCGDEQFRVRVDANEQVGLLTCNCGHSSLLLDSRDYWFDVIQEGRPKEAKCKCGGREWRVSLGYTFVVGSQTVRGVDVTGACIECQKSKALACFEINYEPTNSLLESPLDPCDSPWLKPKRSSKSALWTAADVQRFIEYAVAAERVAVYSQLPREGIRPCSPERLARVLGETDAVSFLLSKVDLEPSGQARDLWKSMPVVHVSSPIKMSYRTGLGTLYYIEYAEQIFERGRLVEQPGEFTRVARRLMAWLDANFTAERGRGCVDNPAEYHRLRGGW